MLVPIVLTRRSWERIGEAERALYQQQLHLLQQSLGAIKDVKVTGRQPFFEERFRHVKRELGATKQRRAWAATRGAPWRRSHADPQHADRRVPGDAQRHLRRRHRVGAGAVRLHGLPRRAVGQPHHAERRLHARGAPVDPQHGRGHAPAAAAAGRGPTSTSRRCCSSTLACEDVSFRYEDGPPLGARRISFTIERGQSIGIVGPTGAGKSTLVDVLLGLLAPTSGRVLIDGEPLEGRERAWQRQIGYVSQDVYLLDDSLRRNIAFGIPDGAIDETRLAAAVAQARLDEVVAALPKKLETVVGENGVRLSGGQRQRVAIARALYHDPPVLVFDEATAALDNQTEREVTEAIANIARHATVIAIAHRLSTVKDCDRLIYLARRPLAGLGTYEELMSDPGSQLTCQRHLNSLTISRTCSTKCAVENRSLAVEAPDAAAPARPATSSVLTIFSTASSSRVVHQRRLVADDLHLPAAARHPHDAAGARQLGGRHAEVLLAHAVDAVAVRRHQGAQLVAADVLPELDPRSERPRLCRRADRDSAARAGPTCRRSSA